MGVAEITQTSSILWLVRFMKGAMEMLGHDDNPHPRYSDQFWKADLFGTIQPFFTIISSGLVAIP